jgi:thymidylate synthase (FAD)
LDTEFKVLDHGYVKLVDSMGDDLTPLQAARMSTGTETGVDTEKDDRLRKRLWGDSHTSPFELNQIVFELQLPMFCLRQIDRHRTLNISEEAITETLNYDEHRKYTNRNEYSSRYSQMPDLYYIPPADRIRGKSMTNKQGSGEALDKKGRECTVGILKMHTREASGYYQNLIEEGVSSEIARLVLPQNQYTKIRMGACLLHWLKFFDLRLRKDVQEETRAYAQAMAWIVRGLWPKCWEVFEEHNLYGARLTRLERLIMSKVLGPAAEDRVQEYALRFGYSSRKAEKLLQKLRGPEDDLMRLLDCVSFAGIGEP